MYVELKSVYAFELVTKTHLTEELVGRATFHSEEVELEKNAQI